MTNETRNKPQLRFEPFEDSWSKLNLNEVSERVKRKNKNLESLMPLTISGKYGLVDQITYFSKSVSAKNLENYTLIKNGEFAYNKSYSNGYPLGAIKRLDKYEKGALSTLYICFKVNEKNNSNFIKYFFETTKWHKEVSSISVEGARNHGLLNISVNDFFNINISLPSVEEQQKIGDFFSKLDRQIELEEQKLEKLEEQKKGYMQKIFSQELRFKDESENDYPEWKERKFSELLSYSSNGVDKKINKNHDIAYMVNYMDVFKKTKLNTKNRDLLMEITATKIQKEKNNLKKGDILFTPSSETREDIAKSTVVFEDLDNTVYSYHLIRLRPLDSNIFSLKYSNYLSEQNFISKQFRRLAQGAQRYTLTKEYFENIKLNLPHIKEQEKIGDFFSKLDKVINKQSQKIDELKLRKQGFLQKMFV
ncbi:Type I restriction-modification system, specificity subunit S [Staphylococcus cohnii subsp. cohnii]|nr:Type I restriction-modification system, specificity subunit S [Staphylococcus cohnii subsp. cohnii]